MKNNEFKFTGFRLNGFFMLFMTLLFVVAAALSFSFMFYMWAGGVILGIALIMSMGFTKLEPNEAAQPVINTGTLHQ